ncbi:carbonic anhydrase 13 [Andrena cerasifolii]|uniref:carbonic anhydrase 13 n=1 Tax=Andrena cerasifolii TaxID=2819439 RepID=UPI0040376C7C
MTFLAFALGPLLLSKMVVGDFGYDGNHGPSHWGDEFKTCLGKYQSPIDIEDKDVTLTAFPRLQFSKIQNPHRSYMTNNGHTVMIQTFDTELPTISGGPINDTYAFQQLHFHWGQSDERGSEDLINNHSFSMELHAVFYKESYGSSEEAMKHSDGLTVLAYLYEGTDEPNPTFNSVVSQVPDITAVGSNATINDANLLNKLIAPSIASAQNYYTYKGSLTTPPCSEIVQWIDFIKPQTISHDQLAAFRSIQSADGANLTHNFRPVQPLNDRVIYQNNINEITEAPGSMTTSIPETKTTIQQSDVPQNTNSSQHSGQERTWPASSIGVILGIIYFLPFR